MVHIDGSPNQKWLLQRNRVSTVVVGDAADTTGIVNAGSIAAGGTLSLLTVPHYMDAPRSIVFTLSDASGASLQASVTATGVGQFGEFVSSGPHLMTGDATFETYEVFWRVDTVYASMENAAASDTLSAGLGGRIGLGVDIRDILDVYAITLDGANVTTTSPLNADYDWFDYESTETGTWSIWTKYE